MPQRWHRDGTLERVKRFEIPLGVEKQDDAFIALGATLRILDASATELGCPDFGLRLIRW